MSLALEKMMSQFLKYGSQQMLKIPFVPAGAELYCACSGSGSMDEARTVKKFTVTKAVTNN
jgi:hypothetical protein